jgi:predicted Fe-S protein YdhL (DUF1289 family)
LIPSPCIGVCQYGSKEENLEGICRGCGRTAEEISNWIEETETGKRKIIQKAKMRKERIT